jgi:hypothetical protein
MAAIDPLAIEELRRGLRGSAHLLPDAVVTRDSSLGVCDSDIEGWLEELIGCDDNVAGRFRSCEVGKLRL